MPVSVFNVAINGGVLDLSAGTGRYNVGNENGDPTDVITQIIGAAHPHIYELRVAVVGQYWTLNHNVAGNIRLMYGEPFTTQYPDDRIRLMAAEIGSYVIEDARLIIPNV